MSDDINNDLNQKINQLSSILGKDKIPDNVKNLLLSLAKSNNSDNLQETDKSLKTLTRVKHIMDKLDASNHDERVILLNAVKPFLNSSRQKKLNNCIKLLQMVSLSSLLDENQLGSS